MAAFAQTAKEAREAGLAMVVAGPPQSGKTHLLEIERRSMYATDQEPLFIRLQRETNALKLFQVLLLNMSANAMPADWRLYSLNCLVSLLIRRLQFANIGLVILTNCQVMDRESFNVLFDVMAQLRQRQHPCGLILAGSGAVGDLEDVTADRAASVRQYVGIPTLSHGDIAACLSAWCKKGPELAERAKSEPDAIATIDLVAQSSLGNIARVKHFADLKNRKFADEAFSPRLVKAVYAEMRVGGEIKK
jgi:hypothetical protein